jgi:hypothetical protein
MTDYQPFAISNFRTGFNESVEPWLLPRDAYQRMVNAHLYRGVLEKIEGYSLFAKMTYRTFALPVQAIDGVRTSFSAILPTAAITTQFYAYGTTVLGTSAETFSYLNDASSTVINLVGSAGGTGQYDISTRLLTINFNTPPPAGLYSTVFFAWDSASTGNKAIMGIKPYYDSNGSSQVMVFDQNRVGIIKSNAGVLAATLGSLQAVSEIPHDYYQAAIFTGDGATLTFTGTLASGAFQPGTLEWFQYTPAGVLVSTITDNGFGRLQGTNVDSTVSFISYGTGLYTITFTVAPALGNVFNSTTGVFGPLFTGTISNFFSLVNYQYKAFFTNNVDLIMYYDGTKVRFLNTNLTVKLITSGGTGFPSNLDITTCLHVTVNRERLLLIQPKIGNVPQVAIYWSVAGNPLDFTNNEQLFAPTSQWIKTFSFINTDMVVRFANSERVFRYTGDAFSPFRWDSTNNLWACDAPYSAINYDSWFSSVGRPAIVGSDAVNVKRVDEIIPDFTDPTRLAQQTPVPFMSQNSIGQCYGERFDDIKEGWLCYNSSPQDQSAVVASDNILAFNYLDGTYATYSFPFSCLGLGSIFNVETWGTTYTLWGNASNTWGSYETQNNALIDLAGDQFDTVYQLNDGNTRTIAGDATTTPTPVLMDVISKNFNPFIEDGELCRLGYVDLFVSAYNTSTLRVQFYLNDELYIDSNQIPQGYYQESVLTFTTTDGMSSAAQTKVWKRIYVGAVGKSHTIRFYQNIADFGTTNEQPIYIHSMVLYMKPAGRIFN